MTHEWSKYQKAIFAELADGTGHVVVLARAGSGKTSTIIESIRYIPKGKSILLVAFNKSIQLELADRCPPGCEVRTLHSLGFLTVQKSWGRVRVNDDKLDRIADTLLPRNVENDTRTAFKKLVRLAKNQLVENADEIADVAYNFGVEPSEGDYTVEELSGRVVEALEMCKERDTEIDFDDMVWLPVILKLRPPQFDVVLVDETQDLGLTQLRLAQAACRTGGRIVAVGDDRQAIYGWRGADKNAVSRIVRELGAKVLPLSVTYRCPKKVVAMAQAIVPDLECPPDAPEGEVINVQVCKPEVNDFVLSRTNAPLVPTCLRLLREGTPATIRGRDIGKGLASLIKKSRRKLLEDLFEWLQNYKAREEVKLRRAGRERQIEALQDKVETIFALADGLTTVDELLHRIESMFSGDENGDTRSNKPPRNVVMLSTVHKAKGLEADRVWLLASTFQRKSWQDEIEEQNIFYVAITRAKSTLCLVR